ncbi:hypothetical protein B0H15DRAFT_832077 [Mycena belliarum]|uniref:Uncharacterized protein n=1 Tax=Mycena belliarum TaxID=1033014 RepID=A0AAD6U8E7_9AGAR|nr:hypothetical protein B0H15DRAFT_832077 [Mycena belliae]
MYWLTFSGATILDAGSTPGLRVPRWPSKLSKGFLLFLGCAYLCFDRARHSAHWDSGLLFWCLSNSLLESFYCARSPDSKYLHTSTFDHLELRAQTEFSKSSSLQSKSQPKSIIPLLQRAQFTSQTVPYLARRTILKSFGVIIQSAPICSGALISVSVRYVYYGLCRPPACESSAFLTPEWTSRLASTPHFCLGWAYPSLLAPFCASGLCSFFCFDMLLESFHCAGIWYSKRAPNVNFAFGVASPF